MFCQWGVVKMYANICAHIFHCKSIAIVLTIDLGSANHIYEDRDSKNSWCRTEPNKDAIFVFS